MSNEPGPASERVEQPLTRREKHQNEEQQAFDSTSNQTRGRIVRIAPPAALDRAVVLYRQRDSSTNIRLHDTIPSDLATRLRIHLPDHHLAPDNVSIPSDMDSRVLRARISQLAVPRPAGPPLRHQLELGTRVLPITIHGIIPLGRQQRLVSSPQQPFDIQYDILRDRIVLRRFVTSRAASATDVTANRQQSQAIPFQDHDSSVHHNRTSASDDSNSTSQAATIRSTPRTYSGQGSSESTPAFNTNAPSSQDIMVHSAESDEGYEDAENDGFAGDAEEEDEFADGHSGHKRLKREGKIPPTIDEHEEEI